MQHDRCPLTDTQRCKGPVEVRVGSLVLMRLIDRARRPSPDTTMTFSRLISNDCQQPVTRRSPSFVELGTLAPSGAQRLLQHVLPLTVGSELAGKPGQAVPVRAYPGREGLPVVDSEWLHDHDRPGRHTRIMHTPIYP